MGWAQQAGCLGLNPGSAAYWLWFLKQRNLLMSLCLNFGICKGDKHGTCPNGPMEL